MKLLTDGKAAFPEILRCIREAKERIDVNMFLWRNDRIGNELARALLAAADRGVRVTVTKDRYGVICECCEENRLSFFHRTQTLSERIRIAALEFLYERGIPRCSDCSASDRGELLEAMLRHPNITVSAEKNRYDHSKFWIFDSNRLILGGINVEDKENGCDCSGRVYQDYMAELDGEETVRRFLAMRDDPIGHADPLFSMNLKHPVRFFGAEDGYLQLIRHAKRELTVVMAYFSPIPAFEQALLQASSRGVSVRVLIPQCANFQNDLNRKTVSRLFSRSRGGIRIFLSPKMVHTKLIMSETTVSFGSCNITKKAFHQLDELNLVLPADAPSVSVLRDRVEETFSGAEEVTDAAMLSYRRIMASAESVLV